MFNTSRRSAVTARNTLRSRDRGSPWRDEMSFIPRGWLLAALLCVSGHGQPRDTVIQYLHEGVMNGANIIKEKELVTPNNIEIVRDAALSLPVLRMIVKSFNHTDLMNNYTFQHSWKCNLYGSQVQFVSEQFMYDGKVCLYWDEASGLWTAMGLHATALYRELESNKQTMQKKPKEACTELMNTLHGTNKDQVSVSSVILAVLSFCGIAFCSFYMYNRECVAHPGGVLGSIVHYPVPLQERSTMKSSI
ncbi:uncharacterized protein LOC114788783 isoform X1 [Denticeps clupeoides]|uniref:uncharacterized protein LOC114788783 isoform X1 n=1 Tax=Denticeps clupeoides TaxID=299321 RepID=UPI0010A35C3C|nr:uncharacterized protein LOC114788783 isoform X1 [Denticeps clupeoides]